MTIRSITMRRARTWGWARMRRYDDPYNDLGPSSPHQSCPDCIIATRGYDFREGHRSDSWSDGSYGDNLNIEQQSLLRRRMTATPSSSVAIELPACHLAHRYATDVAAISTAARDAGFTS